MNKKSGYQPMSIFTDQFPPESGNEVNGLNETDKRRASPFFWHKPSLHNFGALQKTVTDYHHRSKAIGETFTPKADRGPKPIAKSLESVVQEPAEWVRQVKTFALDHEANLVGIAAMQDDWVYQGFQIGEPWVIIVGVAMDHEKLDQVPPTFDNPTSAVEVGDAYNMAARSCRKLANFILSQGYNAVAYQGPYASALNMIPAALQAGFGELGKHGSIINRELGSSFRLSAISTDMPLLADAPDRFGADEFCLNCQVCSNACPPDAIFSEKQLVRGETKWYVDFDKCIPFFGEALGCAACIAKCPWSTPGRAPKLAERWTRRIDSSK